MPIGYQGNVNASYLNAALGQLATGLRNACQAIEPFWALVNSLGTAGLEAAPVSMSVADATAFFSAANYLQTMAAVYYGTAAQSPAFNFDSALAVARGGQ